MSPAVVCSHRFVAARDTASRRPLVITRGSAITSADVVARTPSGRSLAIAGRGCRLPASWTRPDPLAKTTAGRQPFNSFSFAEDSMNRLGIALGTFVILGLLSAPATGQDKAKPAAKAAAPAAASVNLNSATQAQLETLPGVGAATAKRIIEYRQKSGGFKKVEELMNVKGIGEKAFLKLKPYITVASAGAATDK
jgi:comEA protein